MGYLTATLLASILIMPALLCSGDKVDVYVLMGQSNKLGEGKIGPDNVNGSLRKREEGLLGLGTRLDQLGIKQLNN